ncbi:MAG TPA: hypothetical protein VM165_04140 [Planctomycetaceae bacterium]|nr:hypothetical protein [Planctomycetaceae bacterium]
MIETMEKLYRTLGRVTVVALFTFLAAFGAAMFFAVLGIRQPAESLGQVATAIALLFAGLLGLFLLTALVAAVVRWLNRRRLVG